MPQVESRGRGRPIKRTLPPRIDASPEAIASAFFRSPPVVKATNREYKRAVCGRSVHYPETLHEDGKCSGCHS